MRARINWERVGVIAYCVGCWGFLAAVLVWGLK
jgi:hypothetical protein